MDIPDSIPSLARLISVDEDLGRLCHWSVRAQTCKNPIKQSDVKDRDKLIREVGTLVRLGRRPENTPGIEAKLDNISLWLLCKRRHRKEYSATVLEMWLEELVSRKKEANEPTADHIRQKLRIEEGDRLMCHGGTQNGVRCKNWISNKNRKSADTIIEAIAKAKDTSSTTQDNLQKLAELLMCQRYHQPQAAGKSEEWLAIIRVLFQETNDDHEPPSTPLFTRPFRRTLTIDSVPTQSTVSSASSKRESVAFSTPPTSPPSEGRSNATETYVVASTPSKTVVMDQPQRATRGRITGRLLYEVEHPSAPRFMPYSQTTEEVGLASLYSLVIKKITTKEKDAGYVYGFKRRGIDLIKIGYSKDTEERMRSWKTRCKQEIDQVYEAAIPLANRVENLIHATLHRERRREQLVEGACNGGKGCRKRHKEWFEVTEQRMKEVAGAWVSWINEEPYRDGNLKKIWRRHIDTLLKSEQKAQYDPWRAWLNLPNIVKDVAKAQIELVSENKRDTLEGKASADLIVTTIEISGSNSEPSIDTKDLQQDLREQNRTYLDKIKKEAEDSIPQTAHQLSSQDLPHDPEDPFYDLRNGRVYHQLPKD